MHKGRTILYTIIFLTIAGLNAPVSRAESTVLRPSFPSCKSPQGLSVVNYPEGIHGIPGDSATYYGSDTVYRLSDSTLTQCFCSTNGKGVQTNWWKVTSLSFDEIDVLKRLGWIYVPNGSEWGLEEDPYMALSSDYSCADPGNDRDDNDDDDDDNDDRDSDSEEVLGISAFGDILGLAATGNSVKIAVYAVLSIVTLGTLLYLINSKSSSK